MNWLINRALHLSHATTVQLAKATKQSPETISALNTLAATFLANEAAGAIDKAVNGK